MEKKWSATVNGIDGNTNENIKWHGYFFFFVFHRFALVTYFLFTILFWPISYSDHRLNVFETKTIHTFSFIRFHEKSFCKTILTGNLLFKCASKTIRREKNKGQLCSIYMIFATYLLWCGFVFEDSSLFLKLSFSPLFPF